MATPKKQRVEAEAAAAASERLTHQLDPCVTLSPRPPRGRYETRVPIRRSDEGSLMLNSKPVPMHKHAADERVKSKWMGYHELFPLLLKPGTGIYLSGSTVLSVFVDFKPNDHDFFCTHESSQYIYDVMKSVPSARQRSTSYVNMNGTSWSVKYTLYSEAVFDFVFCEDPLRVISCFDLSCAKVAFDGESIYHPEGWDPHVSHVLFSGGDSYVACAYPEAFNKLSVPYPVPVDRFVLKPGDSAGAHTYSPFYVGFTMPDTYVRALTRALKYQRRGVRLINDEGKRIRIPEFHEISDEWKRVSLLNLGAHGLVERGWEAWLLYLTFGGKPEDVTKDELALHLAGTEIVHVYLHLLPLPITVGDRIYSYL